MKAEQIWPNSRLAKQARNRSALPVETSKPLKVADGTVETITGTVRAASMDGDLCRFSLWNDVLLRQFFTGHKNWAKMIHNADDGRVLAVTIKRDGRKWLVTNVRKG